MTVKQHKKIGLKLKKIREQLGKNRMLDLQFDVDEIRSILEDSFYEEHGEKASTFIYYP